MILLTVIACRAVPDADDRTRPTRPEVDSAGDSAAPADDDDDGDGWPASQDCDDADPSVNPDAEEVPCGEMDEDCDGEAMRCTDEATYRLTEEDPYAWYVPFLRGSGDVDDDGRSDLLIGCYANHGHPHYFGSFRLVLGASLAPGEQEMSAVTQVEFETPEAPYSVEGALYYDAVTAVGDLDADGRTDLLLAGIEDVGWAWFPGSTLLSGGTRTVADGSNWVPAGAVWRAGSTVNVGDVDGDGVEEVHLVTWSENPEYSSDTIARSYLLPAPLLATPGTTLDDAVWSLGTDAIYARGADYDGDGLTDLVRQEPGWECVHVLSGATLSASSTPGREDTDARGCVAGGLFRFRGTAASWSHDLDGDGLAELVVRERDISGNTDPSVYVVGGPALAGELDFPAADVRIRSSAALALWGSADATPDIDGDGRGELLLSTESWTREEVYQWGLVLFPGAALAAGGDFSADEAPWIRFEEPADPYTLIWAVGEGLGSMDGDETPELAFAAAVGSSAYFGIFSGADVF